ncbi:MAG: hypothetical protein QW476_02115, partial [Candidatus Bathyarchaeia archaeon]
FMGVLIFFAFFNGFCVFMGILFASHFSLPFFSPFKTGLIFVCLGIVKYLSDVLHLPFWYSSLISGVLLLLIGLSSLLIAYSRLRF